MIAAWPSAGDPAPEERSVSLVAQGSQEPVKIFAAGAAGAQVRCDARIPLFHCGAACCQLCVSVQHLHGPGASHVTRISPQDVIQCRPAVHELLAQSSSVYPLAARTAHALRRAPNSVVQIALRLEASPRTRVSSGTSLAMVATKPPAAAR